MIHWMHVLLIWLINFVKVKFFAHIGGLLLLIHWDKNVVRSVKSSIKELFKIFISFSSNFFIFTFIERTLLNQRFSKSRSNIFNSLT